MKRYRIAKTLALLSALALFAGIANDAARADERRERAGPRERHERHESRDFYRSPHMVYDNRYQHGRYYPAPGYSVSLLPPGNLSISFGRGHFFFHGGVWYRPGPAGFVVVRPPIGVVIPVLPIGYSTLWLGNVPYYYANDVYYTGGPGNYVVVDPPATVMVEQPAAGVPAPAAAPSAPPQASGTWYYCESAKAYYPYVAECKEGWRPVAATPPSPK